ncbi:MAG TPA: 4Fe-4S binding protein [Chryseolinea sp.]|nr:4Fe-4S binding protein [Chryseolinea sp.]
MVINQKKCVACGNCVAICPMGAIYVDPNANRAKINDDACVECGTCYRGMSTENLNPSMVRGIRKVAKFLRFRFEPEPDVCPTGSFEMNELEMPRLIRQIFSDPVVEHKSTGIKGRGTEEVKTNDVSRRVDVGEVGYTIEFGRPGVGVRFSDIQEMTHTLAIEGVTFESNNPITHLMTDKTRGDLRGDILNEKILSAIVEIKTNIVQVERVLEIVEKVTERIDTVTAVGISTRCDDGEDNSLSPLLDKLGYYYSRAKTNMGLGRITNKISFTEAKAVAQ